ncbi:stage III sporulation protein AG [Natranaerofaba carboxydovora]|uniref:stage III sporulation protein AG n=1 Tax=Natranaerofaba carboxydovora TaxID=2742683 RepID=UPI001F1321EE|nr:stage III sporulation protein AG [Natranaerofaba carboxydovora]UMZ73957.1 spore_III_AG: stage III sporulation protein AG [Natranaerofaba carboxydovora]
MKNNFDKLKIGKIPIHFIVLGVIGFLLLIIGNPFSVDEKDELTRETENEMSQEIRKGDYMNSEKTRYRENLENRLVEILSKIEGAGEVSVLLQLEGGKELDVAYESERDITKTKETDAGGGTRVIEEEMASEEYKMIREGGEDKPLVLRTLKPQVNGVLIVAEGGANIQTQKKLTKAVESLMDVPSHKIRILPQN